MPRATVVSFVSCHTSLRWGFRRTGSTADWKMKGIWFGLFQLILDFMGCIASWFHPQMVYPTMGFVHVNLICGLSQTHTQYLIYQSPLRLTESSIISLAETALLFLMGWNYFTASAQRFGKVHPTTQPQSVCVCVCAYFHLCVCVCVFLFAVCLIVL